MSAAERRVVLDRLNARRDSYTARLE